MNRPLLLMFMMTLAGALRAQSPAQDWPFPAGDPQGTRYSALAQINRENVYGLEPVWTFHTGELDHYKGTNAAQKSAFECTPLMVGGRLYLSTPSCRVFSLDPASGQQLWSYDPGVDLNLPLSELTSRGLSSWVSPSAQRRLYLGTVDARLIALDAASGQPCADFGQAGTVDLTQGVNLKQAGQYQVTSPPAVVGGVVVVGSAIGDNRAVEVERGVVRGYQAQTGQLLWSWDPLPSGPTGAANAWSGIAADPDSGLVFVPTSSASPDFYGGLRPGDNRYANSIVALEAATGRVVWSFQTVHHDLWDYDNAAMPVLINLRGKAALAVSTKMGYLYVLDRQTGQPLFPVEEREVPGSDVPGEDAWPTQPFPTVLPELGLHDPQPWGLTPEKQEFARQWIESLRWEGTFTPPSRQGTLVAPSNVGGSNWSGMSWDPVRQLLFLNVNRVANSIQLVGRDQPMEETGPGERLGVEVGQQLGTPYRVRRVYLFDLANGKLPYTQPPWGILAAVDLSTGKLRWEVPLGWMLEPGDYPMAARWGSLNLGGSLVTAGGLVFVAASMDGYLRAFDVDSGKLLWQRLLPAGGQAAPLTYALGGRQYVVICAGGHAKLGSKLGDAVVAYALGH